MGYDFRKCQSFAHLATTAGLSEEILLALCQKTAGYGGESLRGALLHPRRLVVAQRRIPKKRPTPQSRHRVVLELPTQEFRDAYRTLHRRLDRFLRDVIPGFPLGCVHGFVRDRSTKSNAAEHCESRFLARIDLESFFTSVTAARLQTQLESLGIGPLVATHLIEAVTFDGALIEGLPTSPLLANLAAHHMDVAIAAWVGASPDQSLRYTRYGDDMTLSSQAGHPDLKAIQDIVAANGFTINTRKTTRSVPGQAHFVTGLSVNSPTPRVPKHLKRLLRQHAHHIERVGLSRHAHRRGLRMQSAAHHIWGLLSYVSHVEPDVAAKYRPIIAKRIAEAGLPRSFPSKRAVFSDDIVLIVDETHTESWSAVCMVEIADAQMMRDAASGFLATAIADPGTVDPEHSLNRSGLHFTENHPDTRTAWIQAMERLPMRAYVAYSRQPWTDALYLSLVRRLFLALAPWPRIRSMRVIAEQLSLPNQKSLIEEIAEEMVPTLDIRRAPEVEIAGKEEPLIAYPDYLLGVMGQAIAQREKGRNGLQAAARLKRLWDKYRLVVDVDGRRWFSRHTPLLVSDL